MKMSLLQSSALSFLLLGTVALNAGDFGPGLATGTALGLGLGLVSGAATQPKETVIIRETPAPRPSTRPSTCRQPARSADLDRLYDRLEDIETELEELFAKAEDLTAQVESLKAQIRKINRRPSH